VHGAQVLRKPAARTPFYLFALNTRYHTSRAVFATTVYVTLRHVAAHTAIRLNLNAYAPVRAYYINCVFAMKTTIRTTRTNVQ